MIMGQEILWSQTPEQRRFTKELENHIGAYLNDATKMQQAKEKYTTGCEADHILTDEDIRVRAADAEKHAFIRENMEAYTKAFFPQEKSGIVSDTFICDNGGFENDFQYYRGYSGLFNIGSNTCSPYYNGSPTIFTPAVLPTTREFEIVTTGIDAITGLQKVKFGNKSLKLNDPYDHSSGSCSGNYGVNKLVKRFKVTESNRDFTVWYALALENPAGHINSQPFFSIKCDLAPDSDLCFDADILQCDKYYSQPGCGTQLMDVLDWTCHRVKIPATEIGNIATIEITMGDCGLGGHNGYAYIDGICEECTGSALGSINLYEENWVSDKEIGINYYSCNDTIARVCGSFTLPALCGTWLIDKIQVPGHSIQNITIDYINKTFCFEFPISNFGIEECLEIYAQIFFINDTLSLPAQISNTIEICKDNYTKYTYEVEIGDCKDNNTVDNLSDDYYVTIKVNAPIGQNWTVQRQLSDPYPGESGLYTVYSGSGNETVILGPFIIQEGCWDIVINLPNCAYNEEICPPEYCSGCDDFAGLKISNIKCYAGTPDTWSYDIYVPGSGNYKLNGIDKIKGTTYTINAGYIIKSCLTIQLIYDICIKDVVICPPKPCSESNCDFEVYQLEVICGENVSNNLVKFFINNPDNLSLCYKMAGPSSTLGALLPASKTISVPTGTSQVVIYDCTNPDCYKVIYVTDIGCNEAGDTNIGSRTGKSDIYELIIVPNPFSLDEVTIHSTLKKTTYTIFDSLGKKINEGSFDGMYQNIKITGSAGIYHLMYKDTKGHLKLVRIIKQ